MGHYKSNLRDLEFNLFEVLEVQDYLGKGPYAEADPDTARTVLTELNTLATGVIADSLVDGDRNPPVFDPKTHDVTLPDSVKKALHAIVDGGWDRLSLSSELGGFGIPPSVAWAAAELILGANPAVFFYMAGKTFFQIAHDNGTEEQKRWAENFIERDWGSTMVLTEPDAGSDVGAGRTKAVKQEDGSWHLDGVKRFITGAAQQDMTENMVPMHHFDPKTGELTGERNGAYVTNVEHKMGIKASTTCELTFGQHGTPAKGWLLGDDVNGIAQMFDVIEHARMMVGTKAISTLSTAYLNALEFARERVQGADLTQMLDKTAPRVTITHHPDVRRSLLKQKAYAEGLRGVYFYTAQFQDKIAMGKAAGEDVSLEIAVNDLLLPIVKGVGSERGWTMLNEALQTLGGSGFLQDYPLEQYLRDGKIDSLYEGTTAIQSLDFFFRKIIRDKGRALGFLAGEITTFIESEAGNGRLKEERALLKQALEDVQGILGTLVGYLTASQEDPANLYKIGQHTVRLLLAAGDLVIGWQLQRHAEIAVAALDGEPSAKDKPFYEGKIAAARFFAKTVLPLISAERKIVEITDNSLMELDEAAF
jgi:alkylation response protein AidB-like acyl-CoA dehydrogenase